MCNKQTQSLDTIKLVKEFSLHYRMTKIFWIPVLILDYLYSEECPWIKQCLSWSADPECLKPLLPTKQILYVLVLAIDFQKSHIIHCFLIDKVLLFIFFFGGGGWEVLDYLDYFVYHRDNRSNSICIKLTYVKSTKSQSTSSTPTVPIEYVPSCL